MVTLPVNKIFCALPLYHNLNSCQLNEIDMCAWYSRIHKLFNTKQIKVVIKDMKVYFKLTNCLSFTI